jgi:hypothetical protein
MFGNVSAATVNRPIATNSAFSDAEIFEKRSADIQYPGWAATFLE